MIARLIGGPRNNEYVSVNEDLPGELYFPKEVINTAVWVNDLPPDISTPKKEIYEFVQVLEYRNECTYRYIGCE